MITMKVEKLQIHDVIDLINETLEELAFAYGQDHWEAIARDKELKPRLIAIRDGFKTDILLNA